MNELRKYQILYVKYGMAYVMSMIAILSIAILVLSLSGCRSVQYVPVVEHQIDTLIINQHQRDSIWMHDSIYHHEKGDTVLIEKWHTKYVSKEVHDTLYQSRIDSVPAPYPVTEYVERELTWWQQTRLHLANVLFIALLILGIGWIIKRKFF